MSLMLKQTDSQWTQGQYVNFKDEGKPTSLNAKTRIFAVTSRSNNSFLGYVKWYSQWRKYCYFPVECILDEKCQADIAEFCRTKTDEHKAKHEWKETLPPVTRPTYKPLLVRRKGKTNEEGSKESSEEAR